MTSTSKQRRFDSAITKIVMVGLVVLAVFAGTALVGRGDELTRQTRVRARVWCEALIDRDALRYQDAFRRGYFRGEFDRFANIYREPTEDAVLATMPPTKTCRIVGSPRGPSPRGDVFVDVVRHGPSGRRHAVELRLRREAGFWVIYQVRP